MRFTASEVGACAGGTLVGPDSQATGLSFDSRSVEKGQAFVALIGERDGHGFVGDAASAGAAFAIVGMERSVPGITCVEVDDTARALVLVGRLCRERLRESVEGRVIAITGSAGKTSTKDFVLGVLRSQWPAAHGAHLSFNNDVGVPVTIANAPDGCPALVVEMGMRGHGEISLLCETARPHIGLVTVVGDAHGERLGGIEGVARAKAELVEALPKNGVAVLNADDPNVLAMSSRTGARVLTYGAAPDADVRFSVVSVDGSGHHTVEMTHGGTTARVRIPLPGVHMASNACGAVAAGVAAGVPFARAVGALADVVGAPGRMRWVTAADGTRILDDTYNANPSSVEAALRTLAGTDARRRVAVLGMMAEISDPTGSHSAIAALCRELGIELVAFETDLYGVPGLDLEGAVAAVGARGNDTAVLVKGSRSARTERVVERLVG